MMMTTAAATVNHFCEHALVGFACFLFKTFELRNLESETLAQRWEGFQCRDWF